MTDDHYNLLRPLLRRFGNADDDWIEWMVQDIRSRIKKKPILGERLALLLEDTDYLDLHSHHFRVKSVEGHDIDELLLEIEKYVERKRRKRSDDYGRFLAESYRGKDDKMSRFFWQCFRTYRDEWMQDYQLRNTPMECKHWYLRHKRALARSDDTVIDAEKELMQFTQLDALEYAYWWVKTCATNTEDEIARMVEELESIAEHWGE